MANRSTSQHPPRILFPHSGTRVGGSVVSTALMAHELQRQNLGKPILVLPRTGKATQLHEKYGLATKYLNLDATSGRKLQGTQQLWRKILALPAAARVLSKGYELLKNTRPDIIHVNDDQAILLWGLLGHFLGIPVVWHVRRMTGSYLDPLRRCLANAIVCVSKAAAARLHFHCHDKKAKSVIYNGFDLSKLTPLTRAERRQVRIEIGVPTKKPLVGFVARLTKVKRPEDFVAAGLQVLKEVPSAHFVIVGDDGHRERYSEKLVTQIEEARAEEHFHLLGYRPDASRILGTFDVFVLTSQEEGFGRVVVEAMARGIPVVASNVGGVKEIIDNPGVNGILVPVGDIQGFSNAVVRLLRDQQFWRSISQEAYRSVQSRFDITTIVEQIKAEVYDPLLCR